MKINSFITKRCLLLISVMWLICYAVPCLADGDYVFRKVKWGMSPKDIKASEEQQKDSEFIKDDNGILTYKMNLYDSEVTVTYVFPSKKEFKLSLITLRITPPVLGAEDVEGTLKALKETLIEQYGPIDLRLTTDEFTSWQTSDSLITLRGPNNIAKSYILIVYGPK